MVHQAEPDDRDGGVATFAPGQIISVSAASSKGLSRLVADAEAGRDWLIVRGGKPAAGVMGLDKYDDLCRLRSAERGVVTFLLGVARYLDECPRSVALDDIDEDWLAVRTGTAARPVSIVPSALEELRAVAYPHRLMVASAIRLLEIDAEAGVLCGGDPEHAVPPIRLFEFQQWWVTYAWRPDDPTLPGPCVLEITCPDQRQPLERLSEAEEHFLRSLTSHPLRLPVPDDDDERAYSSQLSGY